MAVDSRLRMVALVATRIGSESKGKLNLLLEVVNDSGLSHRIALPDHGDVVIPDILISYSGYCETAAGTCSSASDLPIAGSSCTTQSSERFAVLSPRDR